MRSRALLLGLLLAATARGEDSHRYGEVYLPAGGKIAYVDVQRRHVELLSPDGPHAKWLHAGVLAVDLVSFKARFEPGRRFLHIRGYDHLGREFAPNGVQDENGTYRTQLQLDGRRVLLTEPGTISEITPHVEGTSCWVFYRRQRYLNSGSDVIARADVATGKADYLKMPAGPPIVWDYITVQDRNTVYLTGRDSRMGRWRHRTWRGDFSKGTWAKPVDGNFAVIDRKGTLLERRSDRWLSGASELPPTAIEIIRAGGRRETLDLKIAGPVWPLFDTGLLVIRNRENGACLIRSLEAGVPDRRLPSAPPLLGAVALETPGRKK